MSVARSGKPSSGKRTLPIFVENLDTARFACVFPTCGGICCRESRPPVTEAELKRIERAVPRILGQLRPAARRVIEKRGFVTNRVKGGMRMLAVAEKWCVFHNEGCTLHRLGGAEGDTTKYKPSTCTLFPLDRSEKDETVHFVRQWGYQGEAWDLPCLDPKASDARPEDSLRFEMEYAARLMAERKKKK